MPVDPLHDWEIGVGKNVDAHTIRIFHAIGGGAINLFDARYVCKSTCWDQMSELLCAGSAKFQPLVAVPSESSAEVFLP